MAWPGEIKAWDALKTRNTKDVEINACAFYDPLVTSYLLKCFGQDISISPTRHEICAQTQLGNFIVRELADYSRLSILGYLVYAKDKPLSGKLIRPSDVPGGGIFTKGTHVLPLDKLAERFNTEPGAFLDRGRELGGVRSGYGEFSLELYPFPRVPVVFVLWPGDEEFSSNASLLFDSSCSTHLPTDIIWATAMMSLGLMIYESLP